MEQKIKWTNESDVCCEGYFESEFFKNDMDNLLPIFVENAMEKEMAERCVSFINNMKLEMLNAISNGIIKTALEGGENDEFILPELDNPLDIFKYCWIDCIYVNKGENEQDVSFIAEGQGEWQEVFGFIIHQGKLCYVGVDYFEEWQNMQE